MRGEFYQQLTNDLETARAEGLFKEERIITSAQQADITVADGSHVINFCANNYLGLANHPDLIAAAKAGMDSHGFGMASVRFICGTQDSHKELEQKLAAFLGMEDAILYSSCFDANGGLFETLLSAEDAIISEQGKGENQQFSERDALSGCKGHHGKSVIVNFKKHHCIEGPSLDGGTCNGRKFSCIGFFVDQHVAGEIGVFS